MGLAVEVEVVTAGVVVTGQDDETAVAGTGAGEGVAGFDVAGDTVAAPHVVADCVLAAGAGGCCCGGGMLAAGLLPDNCGCV